MEAETDVDLFAGPGGWDVGALSLGLDPLGVEWDAAACATRRAAGLRTEQADVAALDPMAYAPVRLLIASPPCQAFSMAGKGTGRKAMAVYSDAIARMARGSSIDNAELDAKCSDPRAHLVLEPLRWALALRPQLIALEQVETVLPLWEATARALGQHGYQTWTGVLSSEQYGVAQTRRRAILLASLDGPVHRPVPTHQRYIPPRKRQEQSMGLFDAPEPERVVAPEDRELAPWVSMAEALGWGRADLVGFPRRADSDTGWDADSAPRYTAENGIDYRSRDLRPASQPAFVMTEKGRSWVRFRSNDRPNATERGADEPAPTITAGHDHAERRWYVTDTGNTRSGTRESGRDRDGDEPAPAVTTRADQLEVRPSLKAGTGEHEAERSADEPAPTLRFGARLNTVAWTGERPATTVAGDPRVFPPGHKINAEDEAAGRGGQQRSGAGWTDGRPATTVTGSRRADEGATMRAPSADRPERGGEAQAVRVTLAEALVLQSFPPDYPVQGTKTKQFEQVGNAIPPLLARACLRELGL